MGAPRAYVIVEAGIGRLVRVETWGESEKLLNWTRLFMGVRTIGLSIPVSGSVAVHETVIVTVFGLNETRSIPCTVALREAVVSLGSTWKLAVVEFPTKLRMGI